MQYILTQAEYGQLKHHQSPAYKAELQKLCTLAANHVPVEVPWVPGKPGPWGCILLTAKDLEGHHWTFHGGYLKGNQFIGYCDLCPAQQVCPHDNKQFRPD